MAIYPGTEDTLQAASFWVDHCVLEDGSVLSPGDALWTPAHLDELHEHYVENPKVGGESFIEKLKEQMEPVSPGATRLMAEMIWAMLLFPTNFLPETKVQKVRTVWEWSGAELPDSDFLSSSVLKGIGSSGPGFINHQYSELNYLVVVCRDLKAMPPDERRELVGEPWSFVSWLDAYEGMGKRQLRHMLPHLVHPESFERIASWNHKKSLLEEFDRPDDAASGELERMDRALLELRRELKVEYPDRTYLDFYRPPLVERWKLGEPPEIELADEALDAARKAFLRRVEGFRTFENPGKKYRDEERGYKEVLRDRFSEIAAELPDKEDLTEEVARGVVEDLVSLFYDKLQPHDHSQNLIGWRYTSFLRELEEGEAAVFVRALIDLLDEEVPSPARVKRFNDDVWPVLQNHEVSGFAISRSLPTIFLWLSTPDQEIYIRTDLFNSMGRRLIGEKLFLNKLMDMGEYQKALAFAGAVLERLEAWGWHPQDMIDVQSFLYQSDWALKEEEKEAKQEQEEKEGGESEGVIREGSPSSYGGAEGTRDLQEVLDLLEEDGFHFPPNLVANFILALQVKRFVILTGISGTGKTQLAIKVGEFYSAAAANSPDISDSRRVLVVAVRPDWTDPRGLTGYHNPITDEYVTTAFLELLLAAKREEAAAKRENRPAAPFFVVLDEMNLARVEHYFSDFLSALESGRPLDLHHHEESEGEGGAIPAELKIPRNVFFTGTVNVDETTHMFSPKVLDRAFTIELNQVDLDGWALDDANEPESSHALHLPRLESNLRWHDEPGAESWREFGEMMEGRLRETVMGLNRALEPLGYHFGYRVAGEIARFVLLAERQGASGEEALWNALDLAVLEKVLPKFNGTEQELDEPLLTVRFVAQHGRAPTQDEAIRGTDQSSPDGARLPQCMAKVDRMLHRLRQRGFAAFIE